MNIAEIREKNKEKFFDKDKAYGSKTLLNQTEQTLYKKLVEAFSQDYYIFPEVCLSAYIYTSPDEKRQELYRHPDFVICNKKFDVLLVVEYNGITHKSNYTRLRDFSVKQILNKSKIDLIQLDEIDFVKSDMYIEIIKKHLNKVG